MISTYKLGLFSEYMAIMLLKLKGYVILEKRYMSYLGEIDIIAKKGNLIVFCEVKTTKAKNKNFPPVSNHQFNRIKRASLLYLSNNNYYNTYDVRFDLIIVSNLILIRHWKGVC